MYASTSNAFAKERGLRRAIVLRAQLPLVAETASKTWIHVATKGEWLGHSAGPFEFNNEIFKSIVQNFRAQANPIPLTYEHPRYAGDGQPILAAGWIHDFAIRPSGLWAFVEFTERAAGYVKAGEYRYCSAVFAEDSTDRKTGEKTGPIVFEVGLVNTPFVDGQEPIRLSTRGQKMQFDITTILKALKELPPDASPEQFHMALDAALLAQQAQEKPEEPVAAEPEELASYDAPADLATTPAALPTEFEPNLPEKPVAKLAAANTELGEMIESMGGMPMPLAADESAAASSGISAALMDILGMDEAACLNFLKENSEAIAAIAKTADVDTAKPAGSEMDAGEFEQYDRQLSTASLTLSALQTTLETVSKELAQYKQSEAVAVQAAQEAERARLRSEASTKVQLAVDAGRISETDAPKWIELGCTTPAQFEKLLSTVVPQVPTYAITGAPKGFELSRATQDAGDDDEVNQYFQTLRHVVPEAKAKELARKRVRERRELKSRE